MVEIQVFMPTDDSVFKKLKSIWYFWIIICCTNN